MYVCICNQVSDTDLRQAYERTGSWKEAAAQCGAGECCGTCLGEIEKMASMTSAAELPVLVAS